MEKRCSFKEILPGLYRMGSPLGPRYVYQYLLKDEDGVVLIDTGMANTPQDVIIPSLNEIGVRSEDIKGVIISHADVDHFSGIKNFCNHYHPITVMAHELDVPWIESKEKITCERYFYYESLGVKHDEETKKWFAASIVPGNIDLYLKGNETISLGSERLLDIIHIPGHTPGHLAIYDRKNKAAIIIDGILWKGLVDRQGQIISPPPYYFFQKYLDSINRILKEDINYLLTGHFDVMQGLEAYQFLQESKEYVHLVSQQVEEVVTSQNKPISLQDILIKTNKRVGNFSVMMVELVGPIYVHLQELEKKGKIHRFYKDTEPCWYS